MGLKINEIFYSLEGEGQWQGYPTIFIRLSGCNLKCSWCDTQHTGAIDSDYGLVIDEISQYPCNRVKVTGGEPLIQDNHIRGLIKVLKDNGYIVALETNGTIFDYVAFQRADLICMDIKTPSSGEQSKFDVISRTYKNFKDKVEFKLVISETRDLEFAKTYALLPDVVLMPDSRSEYKKRLVDEMKNYFPDCRFGLRLHEVLGIE